MYQITACYQHITHMWIWLNDTDVHFTILMSPASDRDFFFGTHMIQLSVTPKEVDIITQINNWVIPWITVLFKNLGCSASQILCCLRKTKVNQSVHKSLPLDPTLQSAESSSHPQNLILFKLYFNDILSWIFSLPCLAHLILLDSLTPVIFSEE